MSCSGVGLKDKTWSVFSGHHTAEMTFSWELLSFLHKLLLGQQCGSLRAWIVWFRFCSFLQAVNLPELVVWEIELKCKMTLNSRGQIWLIFQAWQWMYEQWGSEGSIIVVLWNGLRPPVEKHFHNAASLLLTYCYQKRLWQINPCITWEHLTS